MAAMSIALLRERMDREFAAIRADLKRIEGIVTSLRDAKDGPSKDHLPRALALLSAMEWQRAHCPVCKGTQPKHAAGCELASVLGGR
jgi:hypothetical protein